MAIGLAVCYARAVCVLPRVLKTLRAEKCCAHGHLMVMAWSFLGHFLVVSWSFHGHVLHLP